MAEGKKGSGDLKEVLVTDFTDESARKFREDFLPEARFNRDRPVIVWINSPGGNVDALASMIETINSVPNKVITACIGRANSAGSILLSCGSKGFRYCGPHSRVMIHEVSTSHAREKVGEVLTDAKESARFEEFWLGLLAKNCGIEGGYQELRREIKERDGKIWLNAQEAVKFGIADKIGVPKLKASFDIEY